MKRHRVTNLKLREISSVDRPAQVGAVSVLIKRRQTPEAELIKATFQQALTGCLLADQVRDAFYQSFENMYEGKDAFRKALVDELAAGGDGSSASADYKAWLASLVDKATIAAKAAGAANMPAELNKVFNQAATDWLELQETDMTIKTKAELTAAIEKAQAAGDKVTVGDVTAIHKAATDLNADDLLPAQGILAKGGYMPGEKIDPKTKKKVEQMVKRDDLSADLRKHYDTLTTDEDRDAFLSLSASDQTAELAKRSGDDPVVHTCLDGTEIRKSAGETVLALAKRNDQLARDLAKSNATSEDVTLTKRATDDLGNIGGELVGKKALLKALDSITDASTRDAASAVLKSANELAKGVFLRKGTTAGNDILVSGPDGRETTEAEAKLDEMAKAHAAAHSVTFEKAYSTVIQTTEGAELYKRYVGGEG